MNRLLLYLSIVLLFLNIACANISSPSGGPKDETPPKIVTTESTPNLLTNFKEETIDITFDEWVKLEDIFNQVLISPPLEKNPEIILRKRTVRVIFDKEEALRPNTTYTINFGNAIKDLTEGNVPPNLKYVFSTGNKIDSLSVEGRLVDVQGSPVEDALFMLYENTADSVVRKERPYYFAKSDKNGAFQIDNVKEGTFKYFALIDGNLNYLYDLDTEMIGFSKDSLVLNDSTKANIQLQMFKPIPNLRLFGSDTKTYGLVKLQYNQNAKNANPKYENIFESPPIQEIDKDTLKIWYTQPQNSATQWQILATATDTVFVKLPNKTDFLKKEKTLTKKTAVSKAQLTFISPKEPVKLSFRHPVYQVNTDFIYLLEDTTQQRVSPIVLKDSTRFKQVAVSHKWKENTLYTLNLYPGAIEDIYGLTNDTLTFKYQTRSLNDYGGIKLTINQLNANRSYFFELLDGKGKNIRPKEILKGKVSYQFAYKLLEPDTYEVKITEDLNGNGEWDTGNYDKNLQPERIFIKKLEALRKNWELEATVEPTFGE